jgi:small-conductance mechanosensitive channel
MPELDIKGALGLDKLDIGIGQIGSILIVFVVCIILIGILIFLVVWKTEGKKYNKIICLFSKIGNASTKVGTYKAKTVPIGKVEQLWFVKGIKKYLAPATIQSAPREYWYWIREDGEWINFGIEDLDESQKTAGIKYIHQDMRMQRLATDKLLESRLMEKSFWDKYGHMIANIIYYFIVVIAIIIIFYQFSKIVEKINELMQTAGALVKLGCGGKSPTAELIPASIFLAYPIKWLRKNNGNN